MATSITLGCSRDGGSEDASALPADVADGTGNLERTSPDSTSKTQPTPGRPPGLAAAGPELWPDANWREHLSPMVSGAEALYSQAYEELIIRDFFRDLRGGTFVDAGCYLPDELTNTYYLERHLGWSGIAIDANPSFEKAWKLKRPQSRFISKALTDRDGDVLKFHVLLGMSSLDEVRAEQFGGESVEIEVTTITLNTLLQDEQIEHFDLLSMDIEGAEPAALRGFDIKKYAPKLVCIERGDAEHDASILKYFAENDYERIEKYLPVDKIN